MEACNRVLALRVHVAAWQNSLINIASLSLYMWLPCCQSLPPAPPPRHNAANAHLHLAVEQCAGDASDLVLAATPFVVCRMGGWRSTKQRRDVPLHARNTVVCAEVIMTGGISATDSNARCSRQGVLHGQHARPTQLDEWLEKQLPAACNTAKC